MTSHTASGPETAEENTYRELAQRYPQMKYQVARACAVAGYDKLYQELDVLPETHIAEEARECGSTAIYDQIMAAPVGKQSVGYATTPEFDDYGEETFGLWDDPGFEQRSIDITEDMSVDRNAVEATPLHPIDGVGSPLLYQRLPLDLPTIDEDVLIPISAYYGDIDRYERLRRPKMLPYELNCCVIGIYHNTMFAIWWSKQSMETKGICVIRAAINARFIMNNVLSRATTGDDKSDNPYLI
ncbi:uncharacterized protein LTR77_001237 [Saxophila tyrrhenica]|uniref:Uncharacterized protein n=1 Tax=Saxophila tyrrhenica TaxID=1690608 RepID=A0AAV9PPB7_9PEZI|nr:hypothetical protein LTR77_001237 [Saxophila tyrrhenica]